ncbi:MAG TPA: hypothetical protein VFG83_17115 [Kofleriaceae bacterium]|nr:hypothetical protein [Kofleriaceae bacterium]
MKQTRIINLLAVALSLALMAGCGRDTQPEPSGAENPAVPATQDPGQGPAAPAVQDPGQLPAAPAVQDPGQGPAAPAAADPETSKAAEPRAADPGTGDEAENPAREPAANEPAGGDRQSVRGHGLPHKGGVCHSNADCAVQCVRAPCPKGICDHGHCEVKKMSRCAVMRCRNGTHCVDVGDTARCMPNADAATD